MLAKSSLGAESKLIRPRTQRAKMMITNHPHSEIKQSFGLHSVGVPCVVIRIPLCEDWLVN